MKGELATQYEEFMPAFLEGAASHNKMSEEVFYAMLDFEMAGKKVLDIACGDGHDLARYKAKGAICHGIDASRTMVELARHNAPGAEIREGFMERLPYEDCFFDIVLSKYALQTSDDVPAAIAEMGRVLKNGGLMVYLTVHPLRQFLEKKKHPKDYFLQEIVESAFFEGAVTVREPTHTLNEYIGPGFLQQFRLLHLEENPDFPSVVRVEGDTYPCYFVLKAIKSENK
jgi:ubiquinone/menaquinone biosynthesis C-methylase UbiE